MLMAVSIEHDLRCISFHILIFNLYKIGHMQDYVYFSLSKSIVNGPMIMLWLTGIVHEKNQYSIKKYNTKYLLFFL